MDELGLLHGNLFVGAVLFGLGAIGFLTRRNMIVMFLAAEMMLQGVSVSLVAWSRYHNNFDGQVLTIFILTVAACEAAVGLALITVIFRRSGSLDIAYWHQVREANQPAFVDEEIPEDADIGESHWPELTPAGIVPEEVDVEEVYHRTHV
jgi:NADH-quinone oxidoreductase subunit K